MIYFSISERMCDLFLVLSMGTMVLTAVRAEEVVFRLDEAVSRGIQPDHKHGRVLLVPCKK